MIDIANTVQRLAKSIENYRVAKNQTQRDAALLFITERAVDLVHRRDALLRKIEEGWSWLEPYDYEDPAVRDQEDRFVAWNAELRQITDVLDAAEAVVSGRDAA